MATGSGTVRRKAAKTTAAPAPATSPAPAPAVDPHVLLRQSLAVGIGGRITRRVFEALPRIEEAAARGLRAGVDVKVRLYVDEASKEMRCAIAFAEEITGLADEYQVKQAESGDALELVALDRWGA